MEHLDGSVEPQRRGIGRPSKAEPAWHKIAVLPEDQPEPLTAEVLRHMRLEGYEGAKSAMYAMVRPLRSEDARPTVRFEGLAGELSQHDFGEVRIRFLRGTSGELEPGRSARPGRATVQQGGLTHAGI